MLFTDLADYTAAVSRSDRAGLVRMLTEHEELVAPVVHRLGGRVVKNLGDSFMCLFDAATDALKAALELQAFVASSGGVSMRIGLTTGDVEEIDGDAFGDAVNLAARILGKTPAGEVWFGPGARACMNPSEIPWEAVGRFVLKGIAGDVDVYRAIPPHRCWLPDPVVAAERKGKTLRVRRGEGVPSFVPPDAVVLFEGFAPGSVDLQEVLARLPVLDPGQLYLATYHISPADRCAWTGAGRQLVVATPQALERALAESRRAPVRQTGSDTIVLDGGGSEVHLVIAGLALPAVPLAEVVASYFYDLLPDGRWVNRADSGLVRVEVHADGARLVVNQAGVRVDGRARGVAEVVPLREGTRVETAGQVHVYRELDQGYVGALLADTQMRLGVSEGQAAEIGREPQHPGLSFMDRRGQENIRWLSGPRSDKARLGGFTLDRALAGRRQATFEVLRAEVRVTPLHDRCLTYVLRAEGRGLERLDGPALVDLGDHVVAGTTVVGLRGPEQG